MIRPSYTIGFATRSESRYPRLWEGCVGAWHPGLGPTGLTLRDWSGYQNHGTLTSMSADDDWVVGRYGYALDFDGTDDYVLIGKISSMTRMTVSFWCLGRNLGTDGVVFVTGNDSGSNAGDWQVSTTGINKRIRFFYNNATSLDTGNNAAIENEFMHVAAVLSGSGAEVFVNGISKATNGSTGTVGGSSNHRLGRSTVDTGELDGQLSDVRIYNRALDPQEISLLARYPGIAYERKTRTPAFIAPAAGGIIPRIMHHRRMQGCS